MSAKKSAKKATKAAKSARKSAKANTPAKAATPAKAEKSTNPATPAAEASEGVYIAPDAEPEAPAATPAKPAAKPAKAKREKSAKAPAAKAPAKPAKAKREAAPAFEPVPLPAHITTPGGAEIEATERAIIVSEGLREVVFDPLSAYYFDHTWTEADGEKLPEPIPAGSVAIRRGDIFRIITPDLKDVVNAVMTARAAALARKRAAKAEKEGTRHE